MGRKSHPDSAGGKQHRDQSPKQTRGFARGHGVHHNHRRGKDAPHRLGTGRDRTVEGTRTKIFSRMSDDILSDLNNTEKTATLERRLKELGQADGYGAKLDGVTARGIVVTVRKGNFLTKMLTPPPLDQGVDSMIPVSAAPAWQTGGILRTFVRGTLQQFDLGLSSIVAPGDEIEMIVPPITGATELFQQGLHAILTGVLPRKNEFRRLHPSGQSVQTLAANVDRVYVVASTHEPNFRPGFVDRVMVCAAASNLPVSLILNKIDLGLKPQDDELLAVYRSLGIAVYKISARDPLSPQGDIAALKHEMAGIRSVLTGHSGVGKSTLLLALDSTLSEELIRTGEVSTQTGKGTHTTTHARLFSLNLGSGIHAEVVDTPGVREFTPADTDRRNLWGWFPELVHLQGQCAFADCTHTVEKECAVLAAVERGEIHPRRHESYVRIYKTLPN